MRRYLTIINVFLFALALITTALLGMQFWLASPSLPYPEKGEAHPFPLASEFPMVEDQDRATIEGIASSLETGDWRASGITVLTRHGQRVGAQGIAYREIPVNLPANTAFWKCGNPLENSDNPVKATGVYVAILDDGPQLYHLLPLTDGGIISTADVLLGHERQLC